MSEQLILIAPISGNTIPLEEVPDPVFASKMVGDGISIDPISNRLLAPCAGKITQIHPSCHAIAVKSPLGPEVLMHVGLDTVSLKGTGFKPLIAQGDEVDLGSPLLEFDADLVSRQARSLMTEVLITNGDIVDNITVNTGNMIAGETKLLTVTLRSDFTKPQEKEHIENSEAFCYSPELTIRNPQGIHARPAAYLVNIAKRYKSKIELLCGPKSANCKSVMSIMALQVALGDIVKFQVSGSDSDAAIKALVLAVRGGLGEDVTNVALPTAKEEKETESTNAAIALAPIVNGVYKGVSSSPGLALGRVFQLRRHEYEIPSEGGTPSQERQLLDRIIGQAQGELQHLQETLSSEASPEKAAIFAAHLELLNDPDLVDKAHSKILKGATAAQAWKESYTAQAERLASLKQPLLAARATDVRDVGERVLRLLLGKSTDDVKDMPEDTIVIAEDLTPSDTATLDRSKVLGFATILGGGTSHSAILARSLDLPAIAGINPKALDLPNGTMVLLDGEKGTLDTSLKDGDIKAIQKRIDEHKALRRKYQERAMEPAITTDGHRVQVLANIGSIDDAKKAVELGAEGVGLLRSEFLFMGRNTPPSEEEQANIYKTIADILGKERPLIIRTLDVGGDKPLPYLPIPKEDNPFLGERGIRIGLSHPDILRTQFRAILRAAGSAQVMVMLPMISSIDEFRQAKAIFAQEKDDLKIRADVSLGAMIEVPSAAVISKTLATEAEFFSIGTNDLTQYTLAIDRGHSKLAHQADALSPAVLQLIDITAKGGHAFKRKVGICGGLAGELPAVPILVGLGIDELSVAAPVVAAVKYTIRNLSYEQCKALADKALGCENAARVRELLEVHSK